MTIETFICIIWNEDTVESRREGLRNLQGITPAMFDDIEMLLKVLEDL